MRRLVDVLLVALRSIWGHRLRSALTLLGIVIGVATIVTVVSAIQGLNGYVRDRIFTLSPDVFIVSKFGIIRGHDEFMRALRRKDLTYDELVRIRDLCESCRAVGATVQGTKALRAGAERLADVQIMGSTASLVELYNLDIIEGRFFTESEERRASPVTVIGWDVRDELFPGVDPIGRILTIEGYPLKVIGVLRRQGSVLGQSQDNIAWMPLEVYGKVFGRNRSIDFWIQASSLPRIDETQDEVRMLLRRLRGLPFRAEDPFGIVNAEALQLLWKGISAAAFAMMVLIAGISLVVGGIVIMNIMLVSVAERTAEIGLRAAVGAKRRDILLQFLLESAVLAGVGGVIGVGLGAGIARAVAALTPFPTVVRPALIVVGLLLATGVGLVFGIWPAWKASRMKPVDAMRSD